MCEAMAGLKLRSCTATLWAQHKAAAAEPTLCFAAVVVEEAELTLV